MPQIFKVSKELSGGVV